MISERIVRLGAAAGALALAVTLSGADVAVPVPPSARPRLYLRAADVSALRWRLAHPVLAPVAARLESLAARSPQWRVEWQALQQLVQPDPGGARTLIDETLALLQGCVLPDRSDACRETGRMMVTGAIVYDWLYARLTPADRQAFIAQLKRLAATLECGYPPTKLSAVTGHASEAMIMRDLLSAGVAIYDEAPEMYRLAAGRFFSELLPARNWFYPGHAYHQGDSYGPYRYSWDLFPLFIFDRLGVGNVYDPAQRFVPYHWIYTTRPDGQRLRAGDTFAVRTPWNQPWAESCGTGLAASYYGDGILLSQFLRQGAVDDGEVIFELLWRDPELRPQPIESLPLSRYFSSPFGWMVARTGWGPDVVVAELKINEYNFTNHQHLDAGAFQLYAQGALAIDSGLYEGGSAGGYRSPHHRNYYSRTIAHNALLIHDPEEEFAATGTFANDGGQRLPHGRLEPRTLADLLASENGYRTGRVLAHGFGPAAAAPSYTVLQGDLTAAYGSKARVVTRSFAFLNLRHPGVSAALVTLDHVVSANPGSRKLWLLHTLEEPQIEAARATADCTERGAHGRLILDVLLPTAGDADLGKVGGPGREYWVFGANYANDVAPEDRARTSMENGVWRLELAPRRVAAETWFLTVLQTTDQRAAARLAVHRIETSERIGCLLTGGDAAWLVLFRRDGRRSAVPETIVMPGDRPMRVLLTELAPGGWRARNAGSGEMRTLEVAADAGTAWFDACAGVWTLTPSPPP